MGNKTTIQLALLIIFSTPSLKHFAQITSHSFWSSQLIFTIFHISTLVVKLRTSLGCHKVDVPWMDTFLFALTSRKI
jgi:hypothetical protein